MKTIVKVVKQWLLKPFPKIIICISCHGGQDQIREFEWIGYVTKSWTGGGKYTPVDYYEVQPLIKGATENRDYALVKETAWQIQHLGLNLYIHYK